MFTCTKRKVSENVCTKWSGNAIKNMDLIYKNDLKNMWKHPKEYAKSKQGICKEYAVFMQFYEGKKFS